MDLGFDVVVTITGIVLVFLILILLMAIITLEGKIFDSMNAKKKAAKEALEDDGYKQGVHFGKNMTKAEAEDLIRQDLNSQIKDISNSYTLTEDSVGNNKNIFLDPAMVKGVKITLKAANSWPLRSKKR